MLHSTNRTPSIIRSSGYNIVITRPSATQVTVTFDEIIVGATTLSITGLWKKLVSGNVTAAITTSGANGLDTGSEAANTWYYIWVITSNSTVALLLSTSATAPTMPSGYSFRSLVGAVRNDGSSNFVDFVQSGHIYSYVTGQTMVSGNVGSAAWTSFSTAAFIPSGISRVGFGSHNFYNANAGMTNNNGDSITLGSYPQNSLNNATTTSHQSFWKYLLLTANTLYWMSNAADQKIVLHGFELTGL